MNGEWKVLTGACNVGSNSLNGMLHAVLCNNNSFTLYKQEA